MHNSAASSPAASGGFISTDPAALTEFSERLAAWSGCLATAEPDVPASGGSTSGTAAVISALSSARERFRQSLGDFASFYRDAAAATTAFAADVREHESSYAAAFPAADASSLPGAPR